MRQPDPEARLLSAIASAAAAELGNDHPLALAARAGLEERTPGKAAEVHALLATLSHSERDRILAAAHREMREDLAAIWAFLPSEAHSGGLH